MNLPFLKQKKWPRIAAPQEEKTYNASYDDQLEAHLAKELRESIASDSPQQLRRTLEAVMLHFNQESRDDAASQQA